MAMEDEGDYELDSFFLCEDYAEKSWKFNDTNVSLLCSSMSSTDHDLTGQIVWPASVILSWYIKKSEDDFHGKNVLELGAGCGLAGFTAAKFCKSVVLTDGNEVVMRLLDKNVIFNSPNMSSNIYARSLLWGSLDEIRNIYCNSRESIPFPDIIIGADVILWPLYTFSLVLTIKYLLLLKEVNKRNSQCIISYVVRAHSTTEILFQSCSKLNLEIKDLPVNDYLPEEELKLRALEKRLFVIQLQQPMVDIEDEWQKDQLLLSANLLAQNFSPC